MGSLPLSVTAHLSVSGADNDVLYNSVLKGLSRKIMDGGAQLVERFPSARHSEWWHTLAIRALDRCQREDQKSKINWSPLGSLRSAGLGETQSLNSKVWSRSKFKDWVGGSGDMLAAQV